MMETLDNSEAFLAATAGLMRAFRARCKNAQHKNGTPTIDMWGADVEGALAEALVAKNLRLYCSLATANPWGEAGDVGPHQVRHTTRINGSLLLHHSDPDDARFYLVVGAFPNQQIVGWILGKDGKNPAHWREGDRPCFFVPQQALIKV